MIGNSSSVPRVVKTLLLALHLTLITNSSNVIAASSSPHHETRLNNNKDDGGKQSIVERGRHNLRTRHATNNSNSSIESTNPDGDRLGIILKSVIDNRQPPTIQGRRKLNTNSHLCKWHADQTTRKGCSNNDNINESWLDVDIYELMFHNSAEECCDTFFSGMDCIVYSDPSCEPGYDGGGEDDPIDNNNNDNSNSGQTIEDPIMNNDIPPCMGWHPTETGCTDTWTYPPEWRDETMVQHMFANSADECCEQHFPGGNCVTVYTGDCDGKEVNNDESNNSDGSDEPQVGGDGGGGGPCAAPGWHADYVMRDGCSNGLNCEFFFLLSPFCFCVCLSIF